MKNTETQRKLSYDAFKHTIDELISSKKINKLKTQEDYFDICGNYWIIDKYIASSGVFDESMTPNTISTYDKAIKQGYAINIPVQLLDDASVVCFEHCNISKLLPNESCYLKTMSLEDIKKLKLNESGEEILTLEEALEHIANRTQVIVEIINDSTTDKLEQKVVSAISKYIDKYDCYENIAVMSINPYSLKYMFENLPYITRILKSGDFKEKTYGTFKTKKLKKLKYYKITHADFISYSHELLPSIPVEKTKAVGILAHTITNQSQYIKTAEHCDNIIFKNFTPTI